MYKLVVLMIWFWFFDSVIFNHSCLSLSFFFGQVPSFMFVGVIFSVMYKFFDHIHSVMLIRWNDYSSYLQTFFCVIFSIVIFHILRITLGDYIGLKKLQKFIVSAWHGWQCQVGHCLFWTFCERTCLITILNRMDQLKHWIKIIFGRSTRKISEKNL